jgi:hypothetical protein
MVQINFRAGENTGSGWEPLPEGTYVFEIQSVNVGNSNAGNPQLEVSMLIMDGPREGETTKTWYSLLPQSGWNLRGLLDALGIDYTVGGADGEGREDLSFDGDHLISRRVEFYVAQRSWNNKINNDFKNPRDPEYVEPADGVEAAAAPAPAPQATPGPAAAAAAAPAGNASRRRPRPQR